MVNRVLVVVSVLSLALAAASVAAPLRAQAPPGVQPVDAWASGAFGGDNAGEIAGLTRRLEGKSCRTINARTFCTGTIGGLRFVVFTTGVGPANVMEAMRDLRRFYPPAGGDYVLKFHGGIAGGYLPMQPGDSLLVAYACVNDWFQVTPVQTRGWIMPREGDTLASLARRYTGDVNRWRELYRANSPRVFRPPVDMHAPLDPAIPLLSPWPTGDINDRYIPLPFRVHTADGRQLRLVNSCFKAHPATLSLGQEIVATMTLPPLPEAIKTYLRQSKHGERDAAQVFVGVEAAGAGFITSPNEARRQKELFGKLHPSGVTQTDMETAYVWWAEAEARPVIEGQVDPAGNVNGFMLVDVLALRTSSDPPDLYGLGCAPAVKKCGATVSDLDYLKDPAGTFAAARDFYNTGIPFGVLTAYQTEVLANFVETGVRLWRARQGR